MSPTLSIIIPAYNAEKYIAECIDCILLQSYKDFELILIDDGSQDRTLSILKEQAIKDSRVKVLSKKNGGVSSARNYGLDVAIGNWIAFIDADDRTNKDYLLHLMEHTADADIVIGGFQSFGTTYIVNKFNGGGYNELTISSFFSENLKKMSLGVPWGKIYKRQIIENNHLRFNEKIHFNEDYLFNQQFFCQINSLYTIPYTDYHWRIENNPNKYAANIEECVYAINTLKVQYDKLSSIWKFQNPDYLQGVFTSQTIRFLNHEAQKNIFNPRGYRAFKEVIKKTEPFIPYFYLQGRSSTAITFFLLRHKLPWFLFIFARFLNPLIRKLKQ